MKIGKIVLVIILMFVTRIASAQQIENNVNEIGLRFGGFSGVDYKHVFYNNVDLRLDLMNRYPFGRGMLEGLVEKNFFLRNSNGFALFIGAGAFVGTDYDHYNGEDFRYKVYYGAPIPGITGIGGIDYYIPRTPVVIGLDIRPRISVYGAYPWDGGISGRIIF